MAGARPFVVVVPEELEEGECGLALGFGLGAALQHDPAVTVGECSFFAEDVGERNNRVATLERRVGLLGCADEVVDRPRADHVHADVAVDEGLLRRRVVEVRFDRAVEVELVHQVKRSDRFLRLHVDLLAAVLEQLAVLLGKQRQEGAEGGGGFVGRRPGEVGLAGRFLELLGLREHLVRRRRQDRRAVGVGQAGFLEQVEVDVPQP